MMNPVQLMEKDHLLGKVRLDKLGQVYYVNLSGVRKASLGQVGMGLTR